MDPLGESDLVECYYFDSLFWSGLIDTQDFFLD